MGLIEDVRLGIISISQSHNTVQRLPLSVYEVQHTSTTPQNREGERERAGEELFPTILEKTQLWLEPKQNSRCNTAHLNKGKRRLKIYFGIRKFYNRKVCDNKRPISAFLPLRRFAPNQAYFCWSQFPTTTARLPSTCAMQLIFIKLLLCILLIAQGTWIIVYVVSTSSPLYFFCDLDVLSINIPSGDALEFDGTTQVVLPEFIVCIYPCCEH